MSFVHCSSCHRAYDLRRQADCPACRQKAAEAAEVQAEAAKLEAERVAAEAARLEAARLEAAKLEAERVAAEAARLEAARLEAARLEAAKLEAERVAAEAARLKAARLEAARLEAARLEAAKLEAAKLETKRVAAEAARLEAARLEANRPVRLADEAELVDDDAEAVETSAPRIAPGDELAAYRAAPREDRIVTMVEELAALLEGASTVELEAAQKKLQQRGLRAPWTAQLGSGGRFLLAAGTQLVTSAIRAPQQGARKLARRLRDAWSGNNLRA